MSDHAHASSEQRQQAMTEALRAWDPEAEVTMESGTGRLVVMTTLPTERVIAILKDVGEHAEASESEPRGHKAGQCCGGCSH
ncbi:hypothetical protein IB223_14180 [Pseudoxanthomonas sp. PXM03]|jgi:hypothetical protein|uniref:hypothetical protein n=1 Tax=Pseudoxanthomonas sp. PXM03 TaxID=2769284 RepID=UPI001781EACD|nr:hypothetical protein [Pseudoxanthomonas sp. PXM03]MBD9437247.1 hypothetical protein [Pseudoxanthomonas sp. PXM03]